MSVNLQFGFLPQHWVSKIYPLFTQVDLTHSFSSLHKKTAHTTSFSFPLLKSRDCFWSFHIASNVETSVLIHMSSCTRTVISQGVHAQVGVGATGCVCICGFTGCCHKPLQSNCTKSYSHHQSMRMSTAPHPCQELMLSDSFIFAYPLGMKWLLLFTGVWLITSEANFFSCLLAVQLFVSMNCPFLYLPFILLLVRDRYLFCDLEKDALHLHFPIRKAEIIVAIS